MGYNKYYRLLAARKMQAIAREHIAQGRSLRWIWKHVQLDMWPMSYESFINLMGERNIDSRIEQMKATR